MSEKKHFYNLVFAIPAAGFMSYSAITVMLLEPKITAETLNGARKELKLPDFAFLFSVASLGHMTQEEFLPPPPQQEPDTNAPGSLPYAAGYREANAIKQLGNPYREDTTQFAEWEHGFRDGNAAKQLQPKQ